MTPSTDAPSPARLDALLGGASPASEAEAHVLALVGALRAGEGASPGLRARMSRLAAAAPARRRRASWARRVLVAAPACAAAATVAVLSVQALTGPGDTAAPSASGSALATGPADPAVSFPGPDVRPPEPPLVTAASPVAGRVTVTARLADPPAMVAATDGVRQAAADARGVVVSEDYAYTADLMPVGATIVLAVPAARAAEVVGRVAAATGVAAPPPVPAGDGDPAVRVLVELSAPAPAR